MSATRLPGGLAYKDANQTIRSLDALDQSGGTQAGPFVPIHAFVDASGALIGQNNGMVVSPQVGTPAEASIVQASLAGLTLLSTVAASSRLGYWFFQNQSSVSLTVVLDDGTGIELSTFVLAPGPGGVGQQGGSMGSTDTGPHTGRIRVYGIGGSQYALRTQ